MWNFGRLGRLFLAAALVGLVVVVPVAARAQAATTATTPVTLYGEGTADVSAELSDWQNDVAADTKDSVDLNYGDGTGDAHARADFIAGDDDYVISGVPFQPSELAQINGGSSGIIAAPILPSGLAFLFNPPLGGFSVTKTDANNNTTVVPYGPDDGNQVPVVPGEVLPGCPTAGCPPFNVPSLNLAAMVEGDGQLADGYPLNYWGQPDVLATWDQDALNYDPSAGDAFSPTQDQGEPVALLRQEPEDETYWLQEYFTQVTPTEWNFPGPITESLPPALAGDDPTELGLSSEITNFEKDYNPKTGTLPGGGVIAEAPPSGATLVDEDEDNQAQEVHEGRTSAPLYPYAVPTFIQLQNANGDWTSPTPGAIDAGVDAGASAGLNACSSTNENALYAATEKVPGAYPLSWVDCLYAPSSGLSVAKADALAGSVRYLVTDGQSYLAPNGDGELPATYVAQALRAANTIVTDNCPGAGGKVILTSRPTSWTPVSSGVTALGAVDECEAPTTSSGRTPTATTSPVTTSSLANPASSAGESPSSSSFSSFAPFTGSSTNSSSSSVLPSPQSDAPGTGSSSSPKATTAPVTRTRKNLVTASIAANLPIPLTTTFSGGLDKLSSLLIGGLLFLLGRRIFRAVTTPKVGR